MLFFHATLFLHGRHCHYGCHSDLHYHIKVTFKVGIHILNTLYYIKKKIIRHIQLHLKYFFYAAFACNTLSAW